MEKNNKGCGTKHVHIKRHSHPSQYSYIPWFCCVGFHKCPLPGQSRVE